MVGIDLAIKIVQRLLSPSGDIVLEICRALWMMHGLFEQSQYETFLAIDTKLQNESERLESELEARLSVAGTGMSEAVSLMNERERSIVHHQANQQRQQLVNRSAWAFRQLLYLQQVVLSKLDIPGFEDGPTVDAESLLMQSYICQYIHSAFYIRHRMGSEPHESMLRSQLKKLLREQEQQRLTGSHSPNMTSSTNPMNRRSSPMLLPASQPPQQYTATPMIPEAHNPLYNNAYQQQQQQQHHQQQLYPPQSQIQPMMMMPNGISHSQQYPPTMMYAQQSMMMPPQSQPFMQQQQQQQPMPSYLPMSQQQQQQQFVPPHINLPPPPSQYGATQQQQQQQQQPPIQYPPYYQQQ